LCLSLGMDKHEWYLVPEPAEEGKVEKRTVGGKSICLILSDKQLYATGAKCPHAGADLSRGWCEAGKLVCPYHRHKFDIVTGKGDSDQGNYIRTYPVKKEDNRWYVGIPKSWWAGWF